MVQLVWHLWDTESKTMTMRKARRWRGGRSLAEPCLERRTHQKVVVCPGLPARQAAAGNRWSEVLSWSRLWMCVEKEQSDFFPEPLKGQSDYQVNLLEPRCTTNRVQGINGAALASSPPPLPRRCCCRRALRLTPRHSSAVAQAKL